MRRVVQFSGGIGSFATAVRIAEQHGTADLDLLFADTHIEDPDLYRFLDDAARYLGVPVTRVCDGRTPWEVFADARFIGNSRLAPCSKLLKQLPCRRWLHTNTDPADTVLYVGLDRAEMRRAPGIVRGWAPWQVEFPMTAPPYRTKNDMLADCRARGIEPPRLYALGYSHNNCGGTCVRAGQKQWRRTLELFPDRYRAAENAENALRAELGAHAILTEQRNNVKYPLPLTELRHRTHTATKAEQKYRLRTRRDLTADTTERPNSVAPQT